MAAPGRELLLRIASAAVLIPAAVAAEWTGGFLFAAVVALAGLLMLWEWGQASRARDRPIMWLAGLLYVGLPCIAIVWIRERPDIGQEAALVLLVLVWATDTGAFFAGRAIGGPKLAPRLSPNKTWSGAMGGIVAAIAVGLVAAAVTGLAGYGTAIWASAVLAVAAEVGDLVESTLKRRFGVKDMGSLIPGHGGVLDRLDSLLLAAPLAALGLSLAGY
jgi:phosphatidate cytidylyltransferase